MDEDELAAAKLDTLKKMVIAYTAIKDLYYMDEMLIEPTPPCIVEMHHEINRLRKDLAGA